MWHARSVWWLETKSYAPRWIPSRHSLRSTRLSGTTVCLRFCCSAPPSPRHHAFCFVCRQFRFSFFGMVVAGEVGFLQRRNWRNSSANSMDEVLAKLFFGERICQNFGSSVFEFGCRKWKRRGLGRNFPFAPLFSFGEFRAGFLATLHLSYQITFAQSPPNRFLTYIKNLCHIFYILISIFDFFV